MKTGFIGAGSMGGAIIKGYADALEKRGEQDAEAILVYEPDGAKTASLAARRCVTALPSLDALVMKSDAVIIALKPDLFETVMPLVRQAAAGDPKVYASIAAGVSIGQLTTLLGDGSKVVRVMPNTPAMVGEGAAAMARSETVTDEEFDAIQAVFQSVGRTVTVEESHMDAVTGISGSSPAYVYMFLEALINCGTEQGLTPETARILAAQATLGAAKMVLETDVSPKQLRVNVCSPGGTTIEAVRRLEERGFMEIVKEAMEAAVARSAEMTKRGKS